MGGKPVPKQDHGLTPEGAAQLTEKPDQGFVVGGPDLGVEGEPSPLPVPAIANRRAGRGPDPVPKLVAEDRRLAFGRPGGADRGEEREAGLVDEAEPGAPAGGVFVSRGQRAFSQS